MASTTSASLLQSIQEGMMKLAEEVDMMENKITDAVPEECNNDDADTVVSLSESDCGSMGSFEQFVHYSLSPPVDGDYPHRSRIPSGVQKSDSGKMLQYSRIPMSVQKCGMQMDLLSGHDMSMKVKPGPMGSDASLSPSWKIGTQNCASLGSPKVSRISCPGLQTPPAGDASLGLYAEEKNSIMPKVAKNATKIPMAPREKPDQRDMKEMTQGPGYPSGQSKLPKPQAPVVHLQN